MRQMAVHTHFYALCGMRKIAAALVNRVKRAIAKQAVKLAIARLRVAWKIFTSMVFKISVTVFHHKPSLSHKPLFHYFLLRSEPQNARFTAYFI